MSVHPNNHHHIADAAAALDLAGVLDDITRALRVAAADHDTHAATMRQAEAAGGVAGFMTAAAAGQIAQTHERGALDLRELAMAIEYAAEGMDIPGGVTR